MRGGEDHRTVDSRGSSEARRRRRAYLYEKHAVRGWIPCHHCGVKMRAGEMQVDRFPVCGHDGGRYTRDNIVPACATCNGSRCNGCK